MRTSDVQVKAYRNVKPTEKLKKPNTSQVRQLSDLYTFCYVRKKYFLLSKMGGFATISAAIVTFSCLIVSVQILTL